MFLREGTFGAEVVADLENKISGVTLGFLAPIFFKISKKAIRVGFNPTDFSEIREPLEIAAPTIKKLAEDMIQFTTPIRERIKDIYNDEVYLRKVVKMGAEKEERDYEKVLVCCNPCMFITAL